MDIVGRRKSHLLTIFPILTGWFLLILVESVTGLIVARFLQGVSMGMLGPLGSVIIGEMTDPKNRGVLLTFISLSLTIGVLFTQAIGSFLSWQNTALFCSGITFTSLLMIIYMPESPPWLSSKGRFEECREVFLWLRGHTPEQEDELEKMILAKLMERKSSVAGQKTSFIYKMRRTSKFIRETYKKPDFHKPIIIMVHMYTMFQFAGSNVFSSYMMDILKQVVGPDVNAKFWMVFFNIERLFSNLLAVFLMTKLKRRTLLFSSGALCVLFYLGKAGYVFAKQNDMLPFENQWIPICLLGIYMFSLSVGVSSIPFAVSGEIFPLAYRGIAGGLSVLALSANFFVAVKSFPVLGGLVGLPLTYVVYGGVVTYCLTVVLLMLPETKDRTLQEIEESFRGRRVPNVDSEDEAASEPLKNGDLKYSMGRKCSSTIIL